ncbi:MAG TPA: CHAT domain-containing protein [Blastocatellia bacterium]|nr:CHAT domain-containing protein [Blastocatellia bacterium]
MLLESLPRKARSRHAKLRSILSKLDKPSFRADARSRVELCRRALDLTDKEMFPYLWADLHYEIAACLIGDSDEGGDERVETIIENLGEALQVYTRDADAYKWSLITSDLAYAYFDRGAGSREENIDRAIELHRQALSKFDKSQSPEMWATTMKGLGDAYDARAAADDAENENAIHHYRQALTVLPDEVSRDEWLDTLTSLGRCYSRRAGGDNAENKDLAIEMYERALEVLTPEDDAEKWASAMHDLGNLYAERLNGDQVENVEKSIAALEKAAKVYLRAGDRVRWSEVVTDLASAYSARRTGDRMENIERSIELYNRALEVMTRDESPLNWAVIKSNLASIYLVSLKGERDDNVELAIEAAQDALTVYTREDNPVEWALATACLAGAHVQRLRGDRAENVELAIDLLQQALEIEAQIKLPQDHRYILEILAEAHLERRRGVAAENIEQSIKASLKVFDYLGPDATMGSRALALNNLFISYSRRVEGEPGENLKIAADTARQALELATLDAFPFEHLNVQRFLGDLYFAARLWRQAHEAYAGALVARHRLYVTNVTPESREAELVETTEMPSNAAYCLARLGRFEEAVALLEEGRARGVREVLMVNQAALENVSPKDRRAFKAARDRVASLEHAARSEGRSDRPSFLKITEKLRAARQRLDAVIGRIRAYSPDFLIPDLNFQAIAGVAAEVERPLVYLLTTSHGSLGLVVEPGAARITDEQVVWLDEFNTRDLDDILYERAGEHRYLYNSIMAERETTSLFMKVLDELWPIVETRLTGPVADRLAARGWDRAVLLPTDRLAILPIGSAAPCGLVLSSTPSALALQSAHRSFKRRATLPRFLVAIANPSADESLKFARLEAEEAATFFAPNAKSVFHEERATREAVIGAFPEATHIHFSGHATFDVVNPMESALLLAEGARLTLGDLLSRRLDLSAANLVLLPACLTGLIDYYNVADEALGFPAAFLQAGAPGVISALWKVDDISAAVLLSRFYRLYLIDGLEPAIALRRAQEWMRTATAQEMGLADYWERCYEASGGRDTSALLSMRYFTNAPDVEPFSHPYYWAAFVFSGAGK